jgi:hypothetical protein
MLLAPGELPLWVVRPDRSGSTSGPAADIAVRGSAPGGGVWRPVPVFVVVGDSFPLSPSVRCCPFLFLLLLSLLGAVVLEALPTSA